MQYKNEVKKYLSLFEKELAAVGTTQYKQVIEQYMRNVQVYRGLRAPLIKQVFSDIWNTKLKQEDLSLRKEVAHNLMRCDHGEDKYCGILILEHLKKHIDQTDIDRIKGNFEDGTIVGWANTDTICGKIFKHWCVGQKEKVIYITDWKKSQNIWLQRASCVSFITLARHGDKAPNFPGFMDVLHSTCQTTIKNSERFVQLGTGWLLREMGQANKRLLLSFIEDHKESFSKEGLRYAVEKLPACEQKGIINSQADQSDFGRKKVKKSAVVGTGTERKVISKSVDMKDSLEAVEEDKRYNLRKKKVSNSTKGL